MAAHAQVSLELLGGIFERMVCTAVYREIELVINLVGAIEAKERTLGEVPLANGRLDENCVPVGDECMYKRHDRKYSRIFRRYSRVVSKGQGSSKRVSLCRHSYTSRRQHNFENGQCILDYPAVIYLTY
jgi:hypothetical protein